MEHLIKEVRQVQLRFQDGYSPRDLSKLDQFMKLFSPGDDIELIGIGASVRGGSEWFQGEEQVREIIESDWKYWGDVILDVDGAQVNLYGEVAWLSTSGDLMQTSHHAQALPFYLNQMKELLEDESTPVDARLLEATHFGMRRLREWQEGQAQRLSFVFSAVLVITEDGWRFRQAHWSMPVD